MAGIISTQKGGAIPRTSGGSQDEENDSLEVSITSPLSNTMSSSSVATIRNAGGMQSPSVVLRTPSFPFPTIGIESGTPMATPPTHLPFTALSPTVLPETKSMIASRLAKSKVADEFKASGSIAPPNTRLAGVSAETTLPEPYELAVRLQTEPGLAGWWQQTTQILRESFSVARATLAIPSDKTEIENVPWAQLAEFVASRDDTDRSRAGLGAGSTRSSLSGSLMDDTVLDELPQETPVPISRVPSAATLQRPRLFSRHSYAGHPQQSPATEAPVSFHQRPRPSRAVTQNSLVGVLPEPRSILPLDRFATGDSILSALSGDTTNSSALSARILDVHRPLEVDMEPLITSAGVVRVLNNSSATILTRRYNISEELQENSPTNQRMILRESQPQSQNDETLSKRRTRNATASTNKSTAAASYSEMSRPSAPTKTAYEDFEQIPGTPWAQSPAPSPAAAPENEDNPFFNPASVKESFRKNPPSLQYQAGQQFEAIGLDASFSIIQLPLIHPSTLLSQPQRLHRFRVDGYKDRIGRSKRSTEAGQTSAGRKRKVPLAILSILVPIVPFPQEYTQYLNSLSPLLATSFYAASQHSNLQKEVSGLLHERNRAIRYSSSKMVHSEHMGSDIFSPLSASSTEYSTTITPQSSENVAFEQKGSGSADRPRARTPGAKTPSTADRDGYFAAVQEARQDRGPSRRGSVRSKQGHSTSQKKPYSRLHSQGASFHKTHPSLPTATAVGQSEDEQSENDVAAQQFKEPSSSMLRSMIDIGATQHLIAEPDSGRLLWVNSKFQAYRNSSAGQKLDDQLWDNIYHKDRKNFKREWTRALETGEQLSQQVRMERFDGQLRWFHLKFLPLKNNLGVIKYWSGQAMDIHELHEAEVKAAKSKEKAASEAKYRAIANSLPVIVFAASVPAGMTFANTQWLSYSGQSLEQALGFGFLEHVHPEDLHKCRFPRVGGNYSTLDVFKQEAKAAEQWSSLRRSDSATSSAGESDAPSAATDRTARPEGTALTAEEAVDIQIPNDLLKSLAKEGIILCARDGQGNLSITTEMRLKSKDNEYRWHLVQGSYIDAVNFGQGDAQWFIACTDISSQKANEAKIQEANSALENVNSALEREMQQKMGYLSSMSHEIRTPLNSIIGNLQFLVQSGLEESALEWAHGAKEAATGMHELINDILDLSKAEAKMLKLEPHWFNPRDLGEQILDILNSKASGKKVELCQETLADVPLAIRGDSGRIKQVLLNLATNAIKFTNEGEVIVRCEVQHDVPAELELPPLKDNEIFIRWIVTDTGIGFTEEDKKLLFKAYSQIRNKATRDTAGTGLGLILCKTMVNLHGGEIEAKSIPGEGSEFSFFARFRLRKDSLVSALPSPVITMSQPVGVKTPPVRIDSLQAVSQSPASLHGSIRSQDSAALLSDSSTSALSVQSSAYQKSIRSSISTVDSYRSRSPLGFALPTDQFSASPDIIAALDTPAATAVIAKLQNQPASYNQKAEPLLPLTTPISARAQTPSSVSETAIRPKIVKTTREDPVLDSDRASFRPPMLSVLVVCPPTETRRITCQRIQNVVPRSVPCNIASEGTMAAAYELLFGKDPVLFTHIVIQTVIDTDALGCIKRILASPDHSKACIVVLTDQNQFATVKLGLPEVDLDALNQVDRIKKVMKPAHPSKLAKIFDPFNENRTIANDPKENKRKAGEKRTKEDFTMFKKALGGKGLRAVAVEDDKMQMNVLNSFLTKICGMTVTKACNGQECLDLYLQHGAGHFSVIVSDTQMPVMNGLTMCRLIRQEEIKLGWIPINIVSLSANVLTKGWSEAADAGFSHYCGKPVSFSELGRILIEVTDTRLPHKFLRDRPKPKALLKALGQLDDGDGEDDEDEDSDEI